MKMNDAQEALEKAMSDGVSCISLIDTVAYELRRLEKDAEDAHDFNAARKLRDAAVAIK